MKLDQRGKIQAMYLWIGGSGEDLRAKTRTLDSAITGLKDLPDWNYDGSSTNQAPGDNSEVEIVPIKMWKCPFRKGKNKLALCECIHPLTQEPIPTNTRALARPIFEHP